MKKTLIFLILLTILVGISPFIGNKIVTYYVNEEIKGLKQKGVTLNFKSEIPGYLYTSKQYEFILTDVEAFARYLTEYGAGLLPPYTDEFLKSIVFRLDMKYNNIPFVEPISIDIYPMYISDGVMSKLHDSDNILFKNFRQFVMRQGLLYHIDYNLLSENYKGHIKNVDYKDRDYDGSNIILTLHNAVFNGTGSFNAPESLKTDIDTIMLKTSDTSKDITLEIKKFTSDSSNIVESAEEVYEKSKEILEKSKLLYEDVKMPGFVEDVKEQSQDIAREMYNTSVKMQSMFFNTKDKSSGEEKTIEAKDVKIDVSSEKEEEKSKTKSYFFFEKLNLKENEVDLNMTGVVYNSSMQDVHTASYDEFQSLLIKARTSPSFGALNDIKVSAINLLSHGLKMDVSELSIENLHFEGKDFGPLKLSAAVHVKEDKNLAAKMLFTPLFIVQNLDFRFNMSISKKMHQRLLEEIPFAIVALASAKQTPTDIVYDVSYIGGSLKINGSSVL